MYFLEIGEKMFNIKDYYIYKRYIDELVRNQNLSSSPLLQDILWGLYFLSIVI